MFSIFCKLRSFEIIDSMIPDISSLKTVVAVRIFFIVKSVFTQSHGSHVGVPNKTG